MINFFKNLEYTYKNNPSKIAIKEDLFAKKITYAELEEYSGRIYGYLKKKNIGKEGVVLVCLPRSYRVLVAMIGIWKAGAAFLICESSMPVQRIEYIKNDSGCKLFLDMNIWAEMMSCKYLYGREKVELHDLAFLHYTSGSTGFPKGVLHEYGDIDLCVRSFRINGEKLFHSTDIFALNSPLHYMITTYFLICVFSEGGTLYVASSSDVKNPSLLVESYEKNSVNATMMTPSLYRIFKKKNSQMRLIILAGEICERVYDEHIRLVNGYSLSEVGMMTMLFEIKKPYERTPVGKNEAGMHIHLIKEDGTPAEKGEIGEVCFRNEYWRGYINMPDRTAEALRGGLFHTGDLAREDAEGNIVILGRNDDMIKINGNRIEPVEIEIAVKEILGLSWCSAIGYVEENRSYICLYYMDDIIIDEDNLRMQLIKRLPQYMIPTYYLRIEEVPMLPNGKLDKKKLPKPNVTEFLQEYKAPETEFQKLLCQTMEKVTGKKVGLNDDFYKLGGDSLSTIEVVTILGLIDLSASDIFLGRTVLRIEKIYLDKIKERDRCRQSEKEAQKHEMPLSIAQLNLIDRQLHDPFSTMSNMVSVYRIPKDRIDARLLCDSINKVIEKYSIFSTVFCFNDENDLVQKIDSSVRKYITIQEALEEDIEQKINSYNKPYFLFENALYDFRIFVTEKNVYFVNQMHHSIMDGTTNANIESCIVAAYKGDELPQDTYYTCLADMKYEYANKKKENEKEYISKYGDVKWSYMLPPDNPTTRENVCSTIITQLPFSIQHMDCAARRLDISKTQLCLCAKIITLAKLLGKKDIMTGWLYSNRDNISRSMAIGPMIRFITIGVSLNKYNNLGELCEDIKKKCADGMSVSHYAWSAEELSPFDKEIMSFVYEGKLLGVGKLRELGAEMVQFPPVKTAALYNILPAFFETPMGICFLVKYRQGYYNESTINNFKDTIISTLKELVEYENSANKTIDELLRGDL